MEDRLGSPGKRPRRQGVWVFYNQAEDQDWPTRDDGPFREAWAEASVDAACFYGRVHSSGGASGGRGSGVPFAIVETAEPYCLTTSQCPVGYRFSARFEGRPKYSWTPCPRAAYCWAAGALTDTPPASGGGLTLLDLTAAGGEFIVRALLSLSQHIGVESAAHNARGTFTQRAESKEHKGRMQANKPPREGLDHLCRVVAQKFKGLPFTNSGVNAALRNRAYTVLSEDKPSQVVDTVLNLLIDGGLAEPVEETAIRRRGRPSRRCRWKAWAAIRGNPASDAFRERLGLGEDDFA